MDFIFYKVVFSGVIDPRKDRKDVAARFARKSRLPLKKVDRMFSSDAAVTIKTDLSKEKAEALKAKLDNIGMRTAVVAVEESAFAADMPDLATVQAIESPDVVEIPEPTVVETVETPDAVEPPADVAEMTLMATDDKAPDAIESPGDDAFSCPECGQAQIVSEQCVSCGKYFSKMVSAVPESAPEITVDIQDADPATEKSSGLWGYFSGSVSGIVVWALGLGGFLFIILKKFGVLKILFAAASLGLAFDSVVDESLQLCLGNSQCEIVVEELAEDCWESSGMDQYDWEAMSDSEFDQRYVELERTFFGCLTYPDGQNLFLKPAYLTGMLVEYCEYDEQCMQLAAGQQRQCYAAQELGLYVDELTTIASDQLEVEFGDRLDGFLGCFVDADKQPLFQGLLL